MKFLKSIVLVCIYLENVKTLHCYWNTEHKYKYFSSKTPYEIVRGDIKDSIIKPRGCEEISVWSIMRHGKRNPGKRYARDIKVVLEYKDLIIASYEIGNSWLCAKDIDNLRNWKINKSFFDKPNEIANEGYQELAAIGKRLKETLPTLLSDLRNEDYLFQSAFGRRIEMSAEAFVIGLTKKNLTLNKDNKDYRNVAPYSTCGKFQVEVLRNPGIYYQVDKYLETSDYLNTKERIEKKLSLNFTLTNDDITGLYDLCRYTWEGIVNVPSPWCALFSVEDLKVLEYIGDLRHYYRNGYGALPYSKAFGGIPLADLLVNFEQAKNGRGKKIVSYFTHATMMDMILVALDLYKDENPLTAHRDPKRKWRSSFLSTFASNMIAVLYRCETHGKDVFDYNVAIYWNEKPVLELCDAGLCSWQEFENKFKYFLNGTADTDFCEFKWSMVD